MPALVSTTATRWTRFGHDRLYVSARDGARVGWVDLHTGATHPSSPEWALVLAACFSEWVGSTSWHPSHPLAHDSGGHVQQVPAAGSAARPGPVYGPVTHRATTHAASPPPAPTAAHQDEPDRAPWWDLATTPPGAAARSKALELARAAPRRTFISRLLGKRTEERAWRIGADGEELVAAALHRLRRRDPRWRLLHAVPVGVAGSDIDHVVIGPGGVFTLNAKHHPRAQVWVGGDTLMVNGKRHPYVRNSRHEAARAARLLARALGAPTAVQGVVVPVRSRRLVVKAAPHDVAVVPAERLTRWLLERPHVLDEHTLWVVSEVARRSTTWQPPRS